MALMEEKLALLSTIERVFEDFILSRNRIACKPGCAVCCTRHLAGTTLEAYRLLQGLRTIGRQDLIDLLPEITASDIFRPRITTNGLAMACMTQHEPPEETPGTDDRPCPFLENNLCLVYDQRPLTCRSMFSQETCQPGGEGEVPPEIVTISTVCAQIVEHLDVDGYYGSIHDLLQTLTDDSLFQKYASGGKIRIKSYPTKPLPGLPVPPEQQEIVQEFLERLFKTDCEGMTFREKMAAIRDAPF